MKYLVPAMLLVAAVIHLLPVSGVLGPERLASLYGLRFDEPNLAILMRHRAVLFGLLGVFLLFAAFRQGWQTVGYVAAFVSVVSFLWLAYSTGGYSSYIARVVTMDWIALACLVVGVAAGVIARRRG
jgi:hypothetical protein